MLLSLHIKNIALIAELNLEFGRGLNILSGETGAGKSIIIDSLNFVLGDRADKSLIRHGQTSASVQAVFVAADNPDLSAALDENGIEKDDTVIVRRTMTENGRSECRVNGTIINLSSLKRIMSLLTDIHSQHENQALLNEASHIDILDKYSKTAQLIKEEYRKNYFAYKKTAQELASIPPQGERERKIDILLFQLAEIENVGVKEGEEEGLIKERAKFYNSQKLINGLGGALTLLEGDSGFGAVPSVHSAIKELVGLSQYDDAYGALADRLESVKIELSDIIDTLKSELDSATFDPASMQAVEKRIEEIRKIKRRFGNDLKEIEDFRVKAQAELDALRSAADKEERLAAELQAAKSCALKLAKELHNLRLTESGTFSRSIIDNLAELGMSGSTFEVSVEYTIGEDAERLNENGGDTVRFLISPNKGEPLKPLAKIASGGEMSRFMLGLKNITAELENIDTLVFDEIDTGISGHIAKVVACKLYNIARTRQVLAVTHLPQLASMADTHYLISKHTLADKTETFVEALDTDTSLKEIMRLAGSLDKSQSGLENAKELKDWAESYKNTANLE